MNDCWSYHSRRIHYVYKNNKTSSSAQNKKSNNILSKMIDQDAILQEKLAKLEEQKHLRKLNLLEDEKNMKECEENKIRHYQKENNNDKTIQFLLTDEENTDQLVSSIQKNNLQKQEKFLCHLIEVEKTSKELIKNTLNLNESFEMDYNEKYSKCDLIKNTKNNDKLKLKKENKEFTLRLEQIIEKANLQRYVLVNNESKSDSSEMERLTNLLNTSNCYRQVSKEHLKSMYNQLKYLTTAELHKRNCQLNKQINDLSTERITLTQLLVDFIDKKKLNQKYLIQKLEAQQFEFDTTIKWLSQYSKLVNDMPSELTFSKNSINPTLLHRVCTMGGSHLLLFILENELKLPLTKEYLINMGIHSCKDQEILINSLNYFSTPTAPPENMFTPSAPFLDELECIVCMEKQFDVLFIPCGHLCCCWKCSEKLTLCPMCRTLISKKVDIKNIN
ncbi:E3 ubiquitin-protein ligase LRSAM1-like isoform X2 [Sipha flava]|uniref:E3 ubiquitin-protein ligase LRSAM1-like isoform X2 n=1 Tax=Sipha flava TaxID=143950 RepID=A0A8B8F5G8_9HEMI|nr:E3 ubiquitin-protein ligase LRSAM1-like isoform X2 [Sipha flava]